MKINIITRFLVVFLLTNLAISCVKDTDYELPDTTVPVPKFDGTIKTIDDVVGTTTDKVTEYLDNDALEGYVISSDEGGNFYKKIYVENAEKTQGFAIAIDKGGLYSEFPLGAKVQIRLKGLSVQLVDDHLEVGYKTYTAKNGRVSVGTMPSNVYKKHFYNLQEELKNKGELAKASPSVEELKKKENVNLLLTFENVYFEKSAVGKSFHEKENDGKFGTNYNLIDSKGKKIEFRTSKFAKFKDEKVPNGLLKVTGILTTFKGSYQFLANNIDDIEVVGDTPTTGGVSGAVLNLPVEQKFDKGVPTTWQNIDAKGGRTWQNSKSGNAVQMSAYAGKNKILDVETWLVSPKINLGDTEGNILKIKLADAHQNGNPLKIVYSSDYDGTDIKSATWKEIGADAVKALINNSGGYDDKYEESQPIKIPAKGEVYIAFVYESKGKISTTVQLESVSITKESGTTPPATSGEAKSIADIRTMFTGKEITIEEDYTIEGVVISDRTTGNIHENNVVIQDNTAGITLRFKTKHDLNLGQKIKVPVKGAELSKFGGLLQINKLENSAILSKEDGALPTPKEVSIKDILSGKYESQLVKINDVQFKDTTKKYSGANIITNCTDEITTYVRKDATFANDKVNDKRGSIMGYVSKFNNPQLIINSTSDVNFTENYKDCSASTGGNPSTGGTTQPSTTASDGDLIISEYVEGSSNNKYIEIYNASDKVADLSKYRLELYVNGKSTVENKLELKDIQATLEAGKIMVIKHEQAKLEVSTGVLVHESKVTYFSGDDAIALLKEEKIIDIIGKIGEKPKDGWDVAGVSKATKDHTLVRKSSINKGTTDWAVSAGTDADNSQWIVKDKNDASNLGKR